MNLALLGWTPGLNPLLKELAGAGGHSLLAAACVPGEAATDILKEFPALRMHADWESLVGSLQADAVLVAGASEAVMAGARQLASSGTPLIVHPSAAQKTSFIYELTLAHDDNRVPLIPLPELRCHPLVLASKAMLETASHEAPQTGSAGIGAVRLFRLEHTIDDRLAGQGLTRAVIDEHLLHDAHVLRFLGGSFNRVTAVDTGTATGGIAQTMVTLAGQNLPEAIWTLKTGRPDWHLSIIGSEGTLSLRMFNTAARLELTHSDSSIAPVLVEEAGPPLEAGLGHQQLKFIERCLASGSGSEWTELTRTFETVEATHASLRRRRTVDLFFETTSERSIFKSQMTAAGCGLLMLTLFLLMGFLLLGAVLDSRSMGQRRAEAERRVLPASAFETGSDQLSLEGRQQLGELIEMLGRSPQPVFIMPDESDPDVDRDRRRLQSVAAFLTNAGHPEHITWLDLATVPHPLTRLLLRVLRVLWIAPLVVFLLMQFLLFVTRPASREQEPERS